MVPGRGGDLHVGAMRGDAKKFFLLTTLLVGLGAGASTAAIATDAVGVVDELHATLIEVMKGATNLGYPGRYQALEPLVRQSFDFSKIAQVVLGRRYWTGLSEEQQLRFIDTFSRLSTATYAARFDEFNNEKFRRVSEETLKKDLILIKTEIVKESGETVRLDYVVQAKDDQWLIVNVIADGVSDLALKQADYTSVLRDQGFDALIGKLNDKIAKYEAGE